MQSTLPLGADVGPRVDLGENSEAGFRKGCQIFNEKSQSQRLAGSQRWNRHSLPGREREDRSQPSTTCLTAKAKPLPATWQKAAGRREKPSRGHGDWIPVGERVRCDGSSP